MARSGNPIATMKVLAGWISVFCLSVTMLQGQEPKSLEELQKQLHEMKDNFNQLVQDQQKKIDELTRQLE